MRVYVSRVHIDIRVEGSLFDATSVCANFALCLCASMRPVLIIERSLVTLSQKQRITDEVFLRKKCKLIRVCGGCLGISRR